MLNEKKTISIVFVHVTSSIYFIGKSAHKNSETLCVTYARNKRNMAVLVFLVDWLEIGSHKIKLKILKS